MLLQRRGLVNGVVVVGLGCHMAVRVVMLLLLLLLGLLGLLAKVRQHVHVTLGLTNELLLVLVVVVVLGQVIVGQVVGKRVGDRVLDGVAVLGHVVVAPGLGRHLEKVRVGIVVVHCGQQEDVVGDIYIWKVWEQWGGCGGVRNTAVEK